MQDKTSNHAPIPTELNIAPRGKSWLHGQLIDGEQGHPTRQSMESADRAQAIEAAPAQAAPAAVAVPDGWKLVPVDLTPEMKREFMDLLMDGIDIYVNRRDQIEIQTDSPRRIWKAVLALSPAAPQAQADARDAELLDFLHDQCIDLRCFTTSDGEDVGWRTVQHHMGEPRERVASEVYSDAPRQAIREAMARIERDPYCTGPLHAEDDAAIAAAKGE